MIVRSVNSLNFTLPELTANVTCYNVSYDIEAVMVALKLRKIGNSVGFIMPQEALAALQVGEGDTLYLTRAPDGYRVTPYDPDFKRQMEVARSIMKQDRNMLHELAKK